MIGYFKPLRRKIGVLTLIVTCAFGGLWCRSLFHHTGFRIATTGRHDIISTDPTGLSWQLYLSESYRTEKFIADWWDHADSQVYNWPPAPGDFDLSIYRFGFLAGICCSSNSAYQTYANIVIPFYAFVIPLMLLSAWLLLSKPRAKNVEPKSSPN